MFRSFFTTIFRGSSAVLCAVARWFAFAEFVLLRSMWPQVYVICNTTIPQNNFHDVHDIQDMDILDIMNIVEIILSNCCIIDDIHMRPHIA